jgi:putative SOS response-associated peptidase YedK
VATTNIDLFLHQQGLDTTDTRSFKLHDLDVRANKAMGELHDRMPVILAENSEVANR